MVVSVLDEHSAQNVVSLDVGDKCQIAKYMVIASGNSISHVKALTEYIKKKVARYKKVRIEGLEYCNWVVLSTESIIVHIFREEVRKYYDLEGLWTNGGSQDVQSEECTVL
ncbi:MAG: ribosome silencing factor [Aaplasma endosymbiont of Hyalomma asiaticum]